MVSNRLTFAALAVACVGAAGAGGYFATRQNSVPAPAAAMAAPMAAPAEAPRRESNAVAPEFRPAPTADNAASEETSDGSVATPPAVNRRTETRAVSPARQNQAATASSRRAQADAQLPPSTVNPAQTSTPPPSAASVPLPEPAQAHVDDRAAAQEAVRAPDPLAKTLEEVVVSANSVLGLQTETRLSSETARVEDRVEAKVTRDVRVGDRVAIPAGSRAIGSVMQVERGGKFKERARIGIRFTTLLLADGTRLPISTETIYREGEAPGNASAAKIGGGAVAGTILGAILGGAKGAAIGATAGAGGGAAAVEAGERSTVVLPAGSPLTARLLTPVTVTIEQK